MRYNELNDYVKEHNIHSVELGFGDINGTLRGKIVTARHFLKNIDEGTDLAKAPFAWDIQCGVYDDVPFANFSTGFPDLTARPILSTFREIPWRPGTAFVLTEPVDRSGNVFEVSPRYVLQRVLKRAESLGVRLQTGSEVEFYLLDSDKKPLFGGVQCYNLNKGAEIEFFLQEVRNSLEAFGIRIEATHVEYGPAQVELIPEYGDPLEHADNTLLIKSAIKQIARKHGLYATFMAKIWAEESGSGYHVHQSLWNKELTINEFEENEERAQQYLAGLIKYASDFFVLGSPTINSYKRLRKNSFAPTIANYAYDNRTVAVRSLLGLGKASRIEYRIGSSDANPYLIIAAGIASGIYGIEHKLSVSKENEVRELPRSLAEALTLFEKSKEAKELFGENFIRLLVTLGKHETELYNTAVTDWERNRYLEDV